MTLLGAVGGALLTGAISYISQIKTAEGSGTTERSLPETAG